MTIDTSKFNNLFEDKKVLVIGGMGFLGSNLAHALVKLNANVTILSLDKKTIFNIKGIEDDVEIITGDIRDDSLVNDIVKDKDYIFNLAAQVSYIDSINKPLLDLEINCQGQLNVLEAVKKSNPKASILFSSSRLVYGKTRSDRVSENHPTDPLSIYGAHKLVAEKYYTIYHKVHGLNTVVARIPNPYGPRQYVKDVKSGAIVGWIMKELMDGKEVKIFGKGLQKRNYIYIDDLIESFLLLITNKKATQGEIFNVGTKEVKNFREMVETAHGVVKSGSYKHVPWPRNFEKNETGDYVPDLTKIERYTGFDAKVSLQEGVKKMVDFYKENKRYYW